MADKKKDKAAKDDAPKDEKDTKPAGEGAEGEAPADEGEGKKKSSKKMMIIIAAGVVLLIAVIVAALFFTGVIGKKPPPPANAEADAGAPPAEEHGSSDKKEDGGGGHGGGKGKGGKDEAGKGNFFDLGEIVVNLSADGRRQTILQLVVQLEVEKQDDKPALEAVKPRIIDNFQTYLRELRLDDLRGSAGLYRLREELLFRVNEAVYPVKVRDVLFQRMLMQ